MYNCPTFVPKLQRYLFGAPVIRLNGKPIAGLPTKTLALLFYLAMTRQCYLRTALAHLLWGELLEQNVQSNLRKTIQQLRTALPDHFQSDRQSAALRTDETVWGDAGAFTEQIAQADNLSDV